MAEDLQNYIYEHIPIVKQNNFSITIDAASRILVQGNYREHINHRNSVFGGSLSTALILAAWAYVRKILQDQNCGPAVIVIQSQEVHYLEPVTADFSAVALEIDPKEKARLATMLNKFSKARMDIAAILTHGGDPQCRAEFQGKFVIVKTQ